MKVTTEFLRGLAIGSDILLDNVENVMSVQALCVRLKRMEGKVSFEVRTYPLDRKVRIKVLAYDRKGFKDSPSNVEGNQVGTFGTKG